jgi:hypothetical protein
MPHGRSYSLVFEAISVSAAGDLLEITAADDKGFEILSMVVTQETSETSEQLALAIYRNSAGGTGGSAVTALALDANNAQAFGGTVKRNMTAPGARSPAGALWREAQNILNGWRYVPVPEERIDVQGNGILAVNLPTAPSVPMTLSLTLTVREY